MIINFNAYSFLCFGKGAAGSAFRKVLLVAECCAFFKSVATGLLKMLLPIGSLSGEEVSKGSDTSKCLVLTHITSILIKQFI